MQDWLGSGDQYVLDSESHFPFPRETVRPANYQSDEPIRYPLRTVGSFEGKYLAENQGVPTFMCRCPSCRNYYYGPGVPRPLRTETVDERDRRMYMNRCRPPEQKITIRPEEHVNSSGGNPPAQTQRMLLLFMFFLIVVVFAACILRGGELRMFGRDMPKSPNVG